MGMFDAAESSIHSTISEILEDELSEVRDAIQNLSNRLEAIEIECLPVRVEDIENESVNGRVADIENALRYLGAKF